MLSKAEGRGEQLKAFINECFKEGETELTKIQGDAGLRSYFRLTNSGNSYILMDCPTWYCSVEPFIRIADHLTKHSISAPKVLKQNIQEGFLLLEDFGNLSVKKYLENQSSPTALKEIYYLIIDLLILFQSLPTPPNLITYNDDLMVNELELFTTWYVPYQKGNKLNDGQLDIFKEVWQRTLSRQKAMDYTTVHRDYHAENMMYLPERKGLNIFGILDFQDTLFGSPIHDLVSVLEDARIRVSRDLALDCIDYYSKKKNFDIDSVLLNYHILGAQRNSRILGVFARKFVRDGEEQYLKYIPIVLEYLEYDLSHPDLAELKSCINNIL